MEISQKVVLITGGNSGLGRAAVDFFVARAAQVVLFDLADKPDGSLPKSVRYFKTDVSDESQVKNNMDKLFENFGRLDVCLNCAGIAPAKRTLNREGHASSASDFSRVININLIGSFIVSAAAAEKMTAKEAAHGEERGVIINTASVAAYDGQKGQCAYAASKGAIVSMTLPMARDLCDLGVRVVAIAPGIMATPMMLTMPEKVQDSLAQSVPFPKRLGTPEEFAALAGHIVENAYINAEVIRLDGALRMS